MFVHRFASSACRHGVAVVIAAGVAFAACDRSNTVTPDSASSDASAAGAIDLTPVRQAVHGTIQAALDKGGTSVSYAVMINGTVVMSDAVGYLDGSHKAPATTDTLYNVGSVSKVVTAAAVMALVDDQRLDLDRLVVDYLPEFTLKDQRYTAITVRMLLNHASGMLGSDYTIGTTYYGMDPAYPDKTRRYFANSVLKAAPGEFSVYCNDGFSVAESLVARVSGLPFDRFVRERLFLPLGMESAGYSTRRFIDGTFAVKANDPHEFQNVMGAGGISTTLSDLARFGHEWLRLRPRALSPSSVAEMRKPQGTTFISGDTGSTGFGLGWDSVHARFAEVDLGPDVLDKSGGTSQFSSQLYIAPRHRMVGAISVTDDYSGEAAATLRDIMARVLRAHGVETTKTAPTYTPATPRLLPASFEAEYAGYYDSRESLLRVSVTSAGTLLIEKYSDGAFVTSSNSLVFDGQDFARSTGQKVLRFVTAAGRKYMMSIDESTSMLTTNAQRISSSAVPLGAWERRLGRLYLPTVVLPEAAYVMEGITLFRVPNLEGILFYDQPGRNLAPLSVVDDRTTALVLQLPGEHGRDLNTLSVVTVNGEEWLANESYQMRPAATLPELTPGTWTIPADGANVLAKLPAAAIACSVPTGGRVIAYGPTGDVAYDSLLDGVDPSLLPKVGYIRLVGQPQARFGVAVVPEGR
jgi:CubicO group peptidase (beta-lactamase class C family)